MPTTPQRGEAKPCTAYPVSHFFPQQESRAGSGQPTAGERAALRVCASCPLALRGQCLESELARPASDQHGVVGGTTASQRRAIIRSRKAALTARAA